MTDLTFCYLHMTEYDFKTLDALDDAYYMEDQLSDEELEIPPHMIPPNPDDSEILPSHVHPSYPYGNPTNLNHPAALPRVASEPIRALYQDIGSGGNINATLRWKELGLDFLLPVNQAKEEALKAAIARKMASGAAQGNHVPGAAMDDQTGDEDDDSTEEGEDDDDEEEEDDDDEGEEDDYENDASRGSFDGATVELFH